MTENFYTDMSVVSVTNKRYGDEPFSIFYIFNVRKRNLEEQYIQGKYVNMLNDGGEIYQNMLRQVYQKDPNLMVVDRHGICHKWHK